MNNWTYTQGDLSSRHFIELMSPQSPAMSFLDFLLMRHDVVGGCESLGENFGAKGFESVSAAYLTQLGVHAGFSLVCRQHVATDWMLAHTYMPIRKVYVTT